MKAYMKPKLDIEVVVTDTCVSSCKDCPSDVDCVNASNGLGTYQRPNGTTAWCNYGITGIGC